MAAGATALAVQGAAAQTQTRADIGVHAVIAYTRVDPVPGGRALGEVRVVQPAVMLYARGWRGVRALATIDVEGLTIGGGELTPGAFGEGFVDRRHPHTYVHELVLAADDVLGSADGATQLSFAVGKGFAPFGTDDPMSRPVLRYPVNHHFAQILERAVAIAGARRGPVAVEAGLFNGDEPERPGQWPRISGRFGDSWTFRLTATPLRPLELQLSHAKVASPEHRDGAGPDQRKWSASGRWEGPAGAAGAGRIYGLLEWARTSEADGFFVYQSLLGEGAWSSGRGRLHYRFERTERPEEVRGPGAFRTVRPHQENAVVGETRWTIHTLGYGVRLGPEDARLGVMPFVELSFGRIAEIDDGLFDVRNLYGKDSFWSLSIAARMTWGPALHRMGRYVHVDEGRDHGVERHH